jgi:hypothetical protein
MQQHSVLLLRFSHIGKQSVFKVLKENPDNFKDLSNLADCDVDVSVTAARRLVIKLYDSRGKIKAEDENLNKLRTRLATVKSACLDKLPPCHLTVISTHHRRLCFYFWTFVCSNCDILHLLGTDKGRCKTTHWGEVDKGQRADVYLEVRKRRGAYIFWMKQVPVTNCSNADYKNMFNSKLLTFDF